MSDSSDDEHASLVGRKPRARVRWVERRRHEYGEGWTWCRNCAFLALALLAGVAVGFYGGAALWPKAQIALPERPHYDPKYEPFAPASAPRQRPATTSAPTTRAPTLPLPARDLNRWSHVLNESLAWATANAPYFDGADADVTLAYWYRWRLFHLHMRRGDKLRGCSSEEGCWVLTEFLHKVFWSGPHNTIVCPAGHHIMEGRWLRDDAVIDDYARFWFQGSGWRMQYTWWPAYALWQRAQLLQPGAAGGILAELFGALAAHYREVVNTHLHRGAGCVFTSCHADGEENSVGLDGCRPTINAAMHGEATALAHVAKALRNASEASFFAAEAARFRDVLARQLWDDDFGFFVTLAQPVPPQLHAHIRDYQKRGRGREVQTYFGCLACERGRKCPPERGWPNGKRVPVRELAGLTSPWYFNAVPRADVARYAEAWRQLRDPRGFGARWGPTTTERRHECFNFTNRAQCNWNGPTWPYETSKAGTGLINLLQTYPAQASAGRADFDDLIRTYAKAHTRSHAEGLLPPHVDEDLHPDDGYWITRRKLHGISPWPKTGGLGGARDPLRVRGTHYFHSTYVDLVLSGVVGVRAAATHIELMPLALMEWWEARHVKVHGREIDAIWDVSGAKYGRGAGLHVWVDGKHAGHAPPVHDVTAGAHDATGLPRLVAPRVRISLDRRLRFVICADDAAPVEEEEPGAWSEC